MTDVVSFFIGTMLNSGGEPNRNNWAPIGHADVPYTVAEADYGWEIGAELKEN